MSERKIFHLPSYSLAGQSWLMNVLIELGVYCRSFANGPWYDFDSNRVLEDSHGYQWMTYIRAPALYDRKTFEFDENIEVLVSHNPASIFNIGYKTIVWYRNLYGTLYSHFRKTRFGKTGKIDDFLRCKYETYRLSPQDEWAINYLLWMVLLKEQDRLVVCYDSAKKEPSPNIRMVLDFLGISRSDAEILDAAKKSTPERILERAQQEGIAQNIVRKGDPDEYISSLPLFQSRVQGLPTEVQAILDGEQEVGNHIFDSAQSLARIQNLYGDPIPRNLEAMLCHKLYSEIAYRRELAKYPDNRSARVIGFAFYQTHRLMGNSLCRLDWEIPANVKVLETFLYSFSKLTVPELLERAAILNGSGALQYLDRLLVKVCFFNKSYVIDWNTPLDLYLLRSIRGKRERQAARSQ